MAAVEVAVDVLVDGLDEEMVDPGETGMLFPPIAARALVILETKVSDMLDSYSKRTGSTSDGMSPILM